MTEHGDIIWRVTRANDGEVGLSVYKVADLDSRSEELQLSVGAVLRQKARRGEFLQYELISGDGPQDGWISIMNDDFEELAERLGPKVIKGKPSASVSWDRLKDPTYYQALRTSEIDVHGLKAMVTSRAYEGPTAPKAPLAIVMVPGNPIVNGWHASMPLPLALEKAFGKAGFPVVRFDWNGHGMNEFTGHKTDERYDDKIPVFYSMCEVAKTLGERIILCTWNYSGTLITSQIPGHGKVLDTIPEVAGVVSLSFAYKQWEFVQKFSSEFAANILKGELEAHSDVKVPAIYVFGSKDVHTPLEDVEQIVRARPDGGCDASIYVVNQEGQKLSSPEYFALRDREEEAAVVCGNWLCDLREKLHVMGSKVMGA